MMLCIIPNRLGLKEISVGYAGTFFSSMKQVEIRYLFNMARTNSDLLNLLNRIKMSELGEKGYPITIKQLVHYCNSSKNACHYHLFFLPKRNGGYRIIMAPEKQLKFLLRTANILLQAIYTPSDSVMGFRQKRNVADNASAHIGKNYIFNSDLKDFFPSINKNRIRAALMAKPICADGRIADMLANLCCTKYPSREDVYFPSWISDKWNNDWDSKDLLPQGSPASPTITNIVCRRMDWQMEGLAKRFHCTYTRYADDITFSSDQSKFSTNGEFLKEFSRIITDNGFRMNHEKTRLQKKGSRQEVTGLTVSEKINVPKDYYRDLRNILHIWEHFGLVSAIERYVLKHGNESFKINKFERTIRGRIEYIKMVKGESDPVYIRLHEQFQRTVGSEKAKSDRLKMATSIEPFNLISRRLSDFEREEGYLMSMRFPKFRKHNNRLITYINADGKELIGIISRRCYAKYKEIFEGNDPKALEAIKQGLYISLRSNLYGDYWFITNGRPYIIRGKATRKRKRKKGTKATGRSKASKDMLFTAP